MNNQDKLSIAYACMEKTALDKYYPATWTSNLREEIPWQHAAINGLDLTGTSAGMMHGMYTGSPGVAAADTLATLGGATAGTGAGIGLSMLLDKKLSKHPGLQVPAILLPAFAGSIGASTGMAKLHNKKTLEDRNPVEKLLFALRDKILKIHLDRKNNE